MNNEYEELISSIKNLLIKTSNQEVLSKYTKELEQLPEIDKIDILEQKKIIVRLRHIVNELLVKEALKQEDPALKLFNCEPETNYEKISTLLKQRNNIKTSAFLIKDKIANLKLKVEKENKMFYDKEMKIASILLFITLMTSGFLSALKDSTKLSTEERYLTRKDIYVSTTGKGDSVYSYEGKYNLKEEIILSEFLYCNKNNSDLGVYENEKNRDYSVLGIDYDYLINNLEEIVNNMSEYIENGNIKPINEPLLEDKYKDKIYKVYRIIQDRTEVIKQVNYIKKNIIIAIAIFLEMVIYVNVLELSKGCLLVNLYKNLILLLDNLSMKKADIQEINKYENILFQLYINDLEVSNLINTVSEDYCNNMTDREKESIKKLAKTLS